MHCPTLAGRPESQGFTAETGRALWLSGVSAGWCLQEGHSAVFQWRQGVPMVYSHNPLNICRGLREWFDTDCFFPMSFFPEAKLPQPEEGTAISLGVQSDLLG